MSSPDVVRNGLVEENWLLAHDGQPTPDDQNDEWCNKESNVRPSQTILDSQPQPNVEWITLQRERLVSGYHCPRCPMSPRPSHRTSEV